MGFNQEHILDYFNVKGSGQIYSVLFLPKTRLTGQNRGYSFKVQLPKDCSVNGVDHFEINIL